MLTRIFSPHLASMPLWPLRAKRVVCGAAVAVVLLGMALSSAHAQDKVGSVDAVIRLGLQTLQLLDQGQSADIWDRASPVMKAAMSKEALSTQTSRVAQALGGVRARDWSTVDRAHVAESTPSTPAGLYVNVNYVVQGNSGATLFELVSFRLEHDNIWRMTGYVPRQQR